jgi:hypothetical protein
MDKDGTARSPDHRIGVVFDYDAVLVEIIVRFISKDAADVSPLLTQRL